METLVSVIAKTLVDSPEDVQVRQNQEDDCLVLSLTVASADLGKVIGKQGRTVRALRSIVTAVASKAGQKVRLDIVE
ncbi:MAG: RNA-binding protein [Deltaproteobacteria bacterium]|nr:MAG: RNA-binding protein [Deltaproteobacteria bacterium]PIE73454.1 MAG: RNA-binding protein [Deltaproteobacteria bacterium]